MIIKNLITHVISAPLEQPFYFSQGYVYRRSSVIVEVIGEDGTSGLVNACAMDSKVHF